MIFALGAESKLRRHFIEHVPGRMAEAAHRGYHRPLNAEGIISLKLTVVYPMASYSGGRTTQLSGVGILVKEFAPSKTIPETCQLLQQLGDLFGKRPAIAGPAAHGRHAVGCR
jgi:ABC-type hemin transport system substrate-binding protein